MSSPSIKIQTQNQLQEQNNYSKVNEEYHHKLTAKRLQNAIKIQNLPYDYDFWEVLEIFTKVGQIKEYYKSSKEMIIIFERQDSVFLSRFFNNHQFGKHEQALRIAQNVQEKDIIDKLFKEYEGIYRIDSANTSFADFDIGQQQQYQSNSTTAIPPYYNGTAKDISNNIPNISPQNFYSQQKIRTKSFIDILHQTANPAGVNSPATNQQSATNTNSNRFLNIPSKQNSNSAQIENKVYSQTFINNPKQYEKSPNIHSYVRNDNILSKYSPHLTNNQIGIQSASQVQKSPIVTINHTNSTGSQNYRNGQHSKYQSRVENKIESDSDISDSQSTHQNYKQKLNELNNSMSSSSSSNLLEKTKKKPIGGYNDSFQENDEIITFQNRSTVRKISTRRLNSFGSINCETEEGLRKVFTKTDIPAIGINDEREFFFYYVIRKKYLLFLIACYFFFWFY